MKDFEVYAMGLCCASVCSSLGREGTEERMQQEYPFPATWRSELRWQLSEDKCFRTGQPNPCSCDQAPETHSHYLFIC